MGAKTIRQQRDLTHCPTCHHPLIEPTPGSTWRYLVPDALDLLREGCGASVCVGRLHARGATHAAAQLATSEARRRLREGEP